MDLLGELANNTRKRFWGAAAGKPDVSAFILVWVPLPHVPVFLGFLLT